MAIDGCQHSFSELAREVLPSHMNRLRREMLRPLSMETFGRKGVGTQTILKKLGRDSDFTGCYVLLKEIKPIYVGISRAVVQRLCQHLKGKTHYDASLAYKIASGKQPHEKSREEAMNDSVFKSAFKEAKEYLRSLDVAFIEIENDIELYLFEVYSAMEFDTCEWNTFRTH
jgi:predicted GIY-YIG superfamily endonuclease